MFDLSDLPPISRAGESGDRSRTFVDIIDEHPDLPDYETTEELRWAINEIFFSGDDDVRFEDAWITTRTVDNAEIEASMRREHGTVHRLHCEVTGTAFYLPAGALVPVVVFETSGDEQCAEPWSLRIHPRLVAEGPEDVMKALVSSYLRNKLLDAGAELMWALEQLNLLREKKALNGGWPDFGPAEEPGYYDADEKRAGPGRGGSLENGDRAAV